MDELNPDASARFWWRYPDSRRVLDREHVVAGLVAEVYLALAEGRHADLNRAMKLAPIGDPPTWRTLAGVHDLEPFVRDALLVPAWRRSLELFLGRPATRGRSRAPPAPRQVPKALQTSDP